MEIVFAVLAKDKAHCLPIFLDCLRNQEYPKKLIHLYIRTNDNKDSTEIVLKEFIDSYGELYGSVFFDSSSLDLSLKQYGQHEWNTKRFKILGSIRQASIEYARKIGADYFIVDCDNLIHPFTLSSMVSLRSLGVISPMLDSRTAYSNYHYTVDSKGYFENSDMYYSIRNRKVKGIFDVEVVHCIYYIRNDLLEHVSYDDESGRYEYVIFSDFLRKKKIGQYLDNRRVFGFISFAEDTGEFIKDYSEFIQCLQKELS
jgi:hypothetical protein